MYDNTIITPVQHTNTASLLLQSTDLEDYRQWVLWRLVHDRFDKKSGEWVKLKKPAKRLYSPHAGSDGKHPSAKTNDPSTWGTFQDCLNAGKNGSAHHDYEIGFVFTDKDPFVFIDLDGAITDGEPEPWADELIQHFNSMMEVSQSGRGIHIFVAGEKKWDRSKPEYKGHEVEVYDRGRFVALTGEPLGSCQDIQWRQDELDQFSEMFDEKVQPQRVVPFKKPKTNGHPQVPLDQIKELLDAVPPEYANDYDLWLDIGMSVKSNDDSEDSLRLWEEWSRRWGKGSRSPLSAVCSRAGG